MRSITRHIVGFTIVASAFLVNVQLALHAQSKGTLVPLDIRKTVDSFRGHWVLTGTDSDSKSTSATQLSVVMDCEPVALGMAVSCRVASDAQGADHVEMASLIGYSPDDKVVRLMEISSSGANHVHTGPWKGDVIQFDRLSYSEAGQQRVEMFAIGFPSPGKMTISSVTETKDGKSTMALVGTRQSRSK